MRKSSICKILFVLVLMGVVVSGCKKEEKPQFLPEAKNDFIFTVIGD